MPLPSTLVARLHAGSSAARWGLSAPAFSDALERSVAHAFAGREREAGDVERYLTSLHLDDLALATACAAGVESAWNHFITEYRPALYRAADAIDRSGNGRELADSLYADLFGLRERDGERQSVFKYFHGRSALGTWVRAVLAQRHVDRTRAVRRLEPLPDADAPSPLASPPAPVEDRDPNRASRVRALQDALSAAASELEPRDRLRLGLYYVQNVKLAAIGRTLGEHEATVSRHLARTRARIRERVGDLLRERHGMTDAAIDETIRAVVDDTGALDAEELIGALPGGKIDGQNRSTE